MRFLTIRGTPSRPDPSVSNPGNLTGNGTHRRRLVLDFGP